jgi:phosphoglycerate dehydrogenase-like enzyme
MEMEIGRTHMPGESVRILVTTPVEEACLRQIAAVSHRVKVVDVSDLLCAERKGDSAARNELNLLLADTEVIFGLDLPHDLAGRTPGLKWVQVLSAGVDHLMAEDILKSPAIMTNIKGMSATPIAEFVFGVALMLVKQLPLCLQLKQAKQWQKFRTSTLLSKTMGIIGLGSIGREVARLAKAFGMKVIAIRRVTEQTTHAENVDIMLPGDQLHRLLAESDFVVLSVPLTPETIGLIGEKELRTMQPTAYLVNIARGDVVDEEALSRALEEGWIAGAGLDVFATEPLPTDSRLWVLPNVILSPHVSGDIECEYELATELFAENLKRYLNGDRLFNVVDKKRGY